MSQILSEIPVDEDISAKLKFQATFDVTEITADIQDLDEASLDAVIKAWEAGASYAMKLCKQLVETQESS